MEYLQLGFNIKLPDLSNSEKLPSYKHFLHTCIIPLSLRESRHEDIKMRMWLK